MRRGRPTREEASKRALAGLDVSTIDPGLVLKTIAADSTAPASARVSAARTLARFASRNASTAAPDASRDDLVTERALAILKLGATREHDRIPCCEYYRGVPIHAEQTQTRREFVRSQIDYIYGFSDYETLVQIIRNAEYAPEARLFAGAKLKAEMQIAAEKREVRPDIDITSVEASVCHLGSRYWRDPSFFTSLLDVFDGAIAREAGTEINLS